ncbi:MAG: hypothetical protein ABSF59_22520 [Candidatus Sulfotelmatobacter sp.]
MLTNWRGFIPESAGQKKGQVAVEFAIKKNGKLAGMKLAASRGEVILDRAAWAGTTTPTYGMARQYAV